MPRRRNNQRQEGVKESDGLAAEVVTSEEIVPKADEAEPEAEESAKPAARAALDVLYCEVCSFPPEYCEFGSHLTKCKAWLEEYNSNLYERYYSADALVSKAGALTVEAAQKLEEDTRKKEAKADAKAELEARKRAAAKVTIKRIERNKRKHITAIHGLDTFGIDLKKAAKQFAQKFATGASVTKNAAGQEEIVVQGDVSDEVEEMLERGGGALGNGIGGESGDGEVVLVEVRGKKGE